MVLQSYENNLTSPNFQKKILEKKRENGASRQGGGVCPLGTSHATLGILNP